MRVAVSAVGLPWSRSPREHGATAARPLLATAAAPLANFTGSWPHIVPGWAALISTGLGWGRHRWGREWAEPMPWQPLSSRRGTRSAA